MENKYKKFGIQPNYYLIDEFKEFNTKGSFNLLEVGCNIGHNLRELQKFYPNAKYYGVDINEEAIEEAFELSPDMTFLVEDISEKNLGWDFMPMFDYILLPDILEHLSDPYGVLKYLGTFLKPDGKIFICIPNISYYIILWQLLHNNLFTYESTGLLDYDHKHLFTFTEIVKMVKETGFKIIEQLGVEIKDNYTEEEEEFINKLVEFGCPRDRYTLYSYHIIIEKDNQNDQV